MASINWPTSLRPEPLPDGYKIKPHEPLPRTNWDAGVATVRRRYTREPSLVQLTWFMKARDQEVFVGFYALNLAQGTRWFNIRLYSGNSFKDVEARFKGVPDYDLDGTLDWRVSATLEVKSIPVYSETSLYLLNLYSDQQVARLFDVLQVAVNEQYPRASKFIRPA